jgi:uncharacterized membrane protein YkoI
MNSLVTKIAAAVTVTAALALGGGAWALAGAGDDDSNATGPAADKARAAALAHLGGGHANAVERDNEDGATWEVELTRSDGNTVDVRLDANYKVVLVEGDSESNDSGENESE